MSSFSFGALEIALSEILDLEEAGRADLFSEPARYIRSSRAIGRAQVVLLTSHLERYIYSVNEEAVSFVNAHQLPCIEIPLGIRLLHSARAVDELAATSWERRSQKLTDFLASDGWLWQAAATGRLEHDRLLSWMTAPKPRNLVRYYKYWGIEDIFESITRRENVRSRMWLRIQGLVDLRNNIAHGDAAAQTTRSDIVAYRKSVRDFAARADKVLGRQISRIVNLRPW